MYAEFAGDPIVQSLAFEDQRHFVVLLCLKCNGTLDRDIARPTRDRIICRGLGLDPVSAAEAQRRLVEVGLIDKNWQPLGWNERQFVSDVSTKRVRKHRKNKETGNVSTPLPKRKRNAPDTDTDTDTEKTPLTPPRGERAAKNRFEEFWAAWPSGHRKRAKGKAEEAWKRHRLDALADHLIADVKRRAVEDQQWLAGFAPMPSTYLNGKRWEDEFATPSDRNGNASGADQVGRLFG
jgi:hypothetical protein